MMRDRYRALVENPLKTVLPSDPYLKGFSTSASPSIRFLRFVNYVSLRPYYKNMLCQDSLSRKIPGRVR